MLFISHRGNLNGPVPERENSPDYIEEAIAAGFTVEVDVKIIDDQVVLGHGDKYYPVSWTWLYRHRDYLLLHLKNGDAVRHFAGRIQYHYFCNEKDEFSLTSQGYVLCWSPHPTRGISQLRFIVPLITIADIENYTILINGGVISDYITHCKEKFGCAI